MGDMELQPNENLKAAAQELARRVDSVLEDAKAELKIYTKNRVDQAVGELKDFIQADHIRTRQSILQLQQSIDNIKTALNELDNEAKQRSDEIQANLNNVMAQIRDVQSQVTRRLAQSDD